MDFAGYKNRVFVDAISAMEYSNADEFQEFYDECFVDDSVTGNGSGSYTCNRAEAQECVYPAMFSGEFRSWLSDTGEDSSNAYADPETLDVYLRISALDSVADELEDEWNARHEE